MPKRLPVTVVDDDESVRESLPDLLKELGYDAQAFSSAADFLASDDLRQTKCLILDIAMPGMSGPDLQRKLIGRQQKIPIIFMTAHGVGEVISRVMADGAVACLLKPFSEDSLLTAIGQALPG